MDKFLILDLRFLIADLDAQRDDPASDMRRQAAKIAGRTASYRLVPDKFFCRRRPAPIMKTGTADCLAPTIVGDFRLIRSLSGQRWDYAGGYAGISGRKTGRFPLNPGYSRLFPHNDFQIFLAGASALPPCLHPISKMARKEKRGFIWKPGMKENRNVCGETPQRTRGTRVLPRKLPPRTASGG